MRHRAGPARAAVPAMTGCPFSYSPSSVVLMLAAGDETETRSVRINYIRRGTGKPLLLVHGLGSSWHTWQGVLAPLAAQRAVVAIDLPGFGKSPPLDGEVTMRAMADAVAQFLDEHDLLGTDAVGSSVGARLVLELARRGELVGVAIPLAPSGFWSGWERHAFRLASCLAMRMARLLHATPLPLRRHGWSRALSLSFFSSELGRLPERLLLDEMRALASAESFALLLQDMVRGEALQGAAAGRMASPVVIGWGRLDRICLPSQAERARAQFPDARLHWFENCGHYPHWDTPAETARLILEATE